MSVWCGTDYATGVWGSTLVDSHSHRQSNTSGNLSEPGTLKRFPGHPRTERALYNMSAMMAAVGAGFDIRLSNFTAFHPSVPGATDQQLNGKHRESYIGQRRDAYFAAVRDSFIAPENSFDDSPTSDMRPAFNNSYQGLGHNRASVDLDSLSPIAAPLQQCTGFRSADSLASTTQSSDDVLLTGAMTNTPSATSRTSSPFQSSAGNLTGETSQSTSIDSEGIDCRRCRCRQSSSGSSPALLETMPNATSRSSNPRSLRRSRDSRRLRHGLRNNDAGAVTPVASGLPPVRPTTLNIVGSTTSNGGSSRKPRLYKVNQSASSSVEDTHQRSFPSPGSTPPHIEHPRLLLDIDLDGLVPAPDDSSSPPIVSVSVVSPSTVVSTPRSQLSVAQLRQMYFSSPPPVPPPTERARNCLVTGYIRMNGGDVTSVPTQIWLQSLLLRALCFICQSEALINMRFSTFGLESHMTHLHHIDAILLC